MAKAIPSTKRLQIDKAYARVLIAVAVTSFVVVFSLIASKALLSQRAYQGRVISAKTKAVAQLKANVNATQSLVSSYTAFVNESDNVLGGNPKGTGDSDGDNAKIVLDALPSKYDFPALATSLEKIMTSQNIKIGGITGTDDEIQQQNTAAPTPQPVNMPFQISFSGNYTSVQNLISILQRSIRPIQIQTLSLNATGQGVQATLSADTFYQPEKNLTITKKEIK
jgi:hypothetical protein